MANKIMMVGSVPILVPEGLTDEQYLEAAMQAHEAISANSKQKAIESQQSSHMGRPILDPSMDMMPEVNSVLPMKNGANPILIPFGTAPKKVDQIRDKSQGLYDLAKEQSGFDAAMIAGGETSSQLGLGVSNFFKSKSQAEMDNKDFKHTSDLMDPLQVQHPISTIVGSLLPYALTSGAQAVVEGGVAKLGAMPGVSRGYRALRNISNPVASGLETILSKPITKNVIAGGVVGGIDPFDTAASGAFNSGAATALLGKPLAMVLDKHQNLNDSMKNATIEWAKKKGFYVTPGVQTGQKAMQMNEQAARAYKDTSIISENIDQRNSETTARVLLHDVFNVKGSELNQHTLKAIDEQASKEIADSLSGVFGNSKMFLNDVDSTLAKALGGRPHGNSLKITDDTEFNRYGRTYDELQELVGSSYITGEKYQKIERLLREERKLANNRGWTEYPKLLDDIDTALDNSIISTMNQNAKTTGKGVGGQEAIDKYNAAKQKYAVAQMTQRHFDNGEMNWGGLHEEMRAFNPKNYGLNNAAENTPIHNLQQLLQYHKITPKSASLAANQEFADTLKKNAGALNSVALEMKLKGVDPKLYGPFSFNSGKRIAGNIGSSNSDEGGMPNISIDTAKLFWRKVGGISGLENASQTMSTGINDLIDKLTGSYQP